MPQDSAQLNHHSPASQLSSVPTDMLTQPSQSVIDLTIQILLNCLELAARVYACET